GVREHGDGDAVPREDGDGLALAESACLQPGGVEADAAVEAGVGHALVVALDGEVVCVRTGALGDPVTDVDGDGAGRTGRVASGRHRAYRPASRQGAVATASSAPSSSATPRPGAVDSESRPRS